MHFSLQELLSFVNVLLVPIAGMLWGIQGRLSKIEGVIEAKGGSHGKG